MENGKQQIDTIAETRPEQNRHFNALITNTWNRNEKNIRLTGWLLLDIGWLIFVGFAIKHSFHGATAAVVITSLLHLLLFYFLGLKPFLLSPHEERFEVFSNVIGKKLSIRIYGIPIIQCIAFLVLFGVFLTWLIIDSAHNRIRIRSLFGIFMYILLGVVFSANPARIKWRPVICGIILQFIVAFLVLRWPVGNRSFKWLADNVVRFLDYTRNGTIFTYGLVADPPNICGFGSVFIYTALQIIIYFGAIVSVLYYLGIIQFVLSRVAWIMQYTVGTTAAESLNAAACIFLGQTEAAILIEPALISMTESEIHSVMTAGFACIAGSLFSAYISFGACPTYLLSATVMSAAVSLAVSKLIYPEIQESKQKNAATFKFANRADNNILECISNGAVHSSHFVWAIGANLIVYIALLAFLNTAVGFLGEMVGIADLSFNKIMGYIFFPLAYMMGASDAKDHKTAIDETLKVAELMGMKTVLNEFIAYQRLSQMIVDHELGARAQMIATYALCGFSNISMIGSQLGILSSMCPKRKAIFSKVVIRALIAGCFSCFMTACVAGILVDIPTHCNPSSSSIACLDLSQVNQTLYSR